MTGQYVALGASSDLETKNNPKKIKRNMKQIHHLTSIRRARVGCALVLAALMGAWVAPELRAQVIVVPNTLATSDGNSSGTAPAGPAPVRWLQIHDASQFGALSGPSLLTQFAYRPDKILDQSGPRPWTLRVYASTTRRSVAGLSTTFAENLGTNNTLVFDGTVTVTTRNLPGPGNTRQFDYVVPFTTPFLYDPAAGNLVLSLQIEENGSAVTFKPATFDTELSPNPAIGRVLAIGSSTATTGTIWADTQVTQFTFEPLPLLSVVRSGAGIVVSWKRGAVGVVLEVSEDLSANSWRIETAVQSTVGDRVEVTIPTADGRRFYRLRSL